ncbi:hypothetical protein QYG06_23355, partial [Xanthomonas euvesicatoria]|uniref:hypothetical protein n=1 Tax=Xanthomonas euvesicatoria TaxID=456327 RepID=UPI003219C82C
ARVGLFDKPDDLLGAESALLHVRPLGFTDFIASAGTAQWGQVTSTLIVPADGHSQEFFQIS